MKVIVSAKYGPADVLQLSEVAKPAPRDTEVLIKIYAATLNRTDCGFLRAAPFIVRFWSGLMKPKNAILGNEFAGQIEAVGKSVTSFGVGDRVFGYNDVTFGAHAEYMVMPEKAPFNQRQL
jgi:NADPH:quinone reductase-like Zn-dependent oxidoreductase